MQVLLLREEPGPVTVVEVEMAGAMVAELAVRVPLLREEPGLVMVVGMEGVMAAEVGRPVAAWVEPERTGFLSRSTPTSTYTVWGRIVIQ